MNRQEDNSINFQFQIAPQQSSMERQTLPNDYEDRQRALTTLTNYRPHSKEFSFHSLSQHTNTKLKIYKNLIYFGQIQNQKKHGQGLLIYDNGRLFEGLFDEDQKSGFGWELFPQGAYYEGFYSQGKPHGQGKFVWPNGEYYEGQWANGLKHGIGLWKGIKGDSYEGEWKIGKADGQGEHVWVNGDRYVGFFSNCLKTGEGTEYFANGDHYVGTYLEGKPEGYGEYYWANGAVFKGYFKFGLRCGKGIWKKSVTGRADVYQGDYKNDKKCGYGVFRWANGNEYRGNFLDDYKHGYGEMYWSDGRFYKGEWDMGKQVKVEGIEIKSSMRNGTNNSRVNNNEQSKMNQTGQIKIRQYSSENKREQRIATRDSNVTVNRLRQGNEGKSIGKVAYPFDRMTVNGGLSSQNSRRQSDLMQETYNQWKNFEGKPMNTTQYRNPSNNRASERVYLRRPNTNSVRSKRESNVANFSYF